MLERRLLSADPYLRAAAVWVAGSAEEPEAREVVRDATRDPHPLVREISDRLRDAARRPAGGATRFAEQSTLEKMQFVRGVPLFGGLDPEDLHDLVRFADELTLVPTGTLCEEGDVDADDLFIVLEGRASVTVRGRGDSSAPAAEREVAVLGAGEVVGEMSMLDGSPRSATVRPKDGPLRVLRIPGQRFRSRLLPRARVARPLLVTLAQRIREMSRRAAGS